VERERVRLRYAQEISHVGSGEWNLQTGATWWSDAMFDLLGFKRSSVEASRSCAVARIHPDDRHLHEGRWRG
jgi:PAS domain-containing protein